MKTISPKLYQQISYYRNQGRVLRVSQRIIGRYGLRVLNGPFKDMKYVSVAVGSVLAPKLVGSYEAELHSFIQNVMANRYKTIVDIGCAEGYYAVGLLITIPEAFCIAFDMEPKARRLCADLAAANGVENRLSIRGKCDGNSLNTLVLDNAFVLCDCEGAEFELLHPVLVPQLRSCDILVELHEAFCPGGTEDLCARFAATHVISIISASKRDPSRYGCLSFLSGKDQDLALQESRYAGLKWAVMKVKMRST